MIDRMDALTMDIEKARAVLTAIERQTAETELHPLLLVLEDMLALVDDDASDLADQIQRLAKAGA